MSDQKRVLIFDLDGVITGERVYWDTAAVALSRIAGVSDAETSLPMELIAEVKARAVNSNWDLAYVVLCCRVMASARAAGAATSQPEGFSEALHLLDSGREITTAELIAQLDVGTAETGAAFLRSIGSKAGFEHGGSQWLAVHDLCQQLHDEKFRSPASHSLERPVVDVASLAAVLSQLRTQWDAELGIATGRPRCEAERALTQFGVFECFTPERIVCYDDVIATEAAVSGSGPRASLTKPHPYSILRAVYPSDPVETLLKPQRRDIRWAAYIGDGIGDMIAAKAAGVMAIGVLTGIPDVKDFRARRARDLEAAGSDTIAPSVAEIPEALSKLNDWRVTDELLSVSTTPSEYPAEGHES